MNVALKTPSSAPGRLESRVCGATLGLPSDDANDLFYIDLFHGRFADLY